MKFLLNQLSKEQLITLIEKQEERHEKAMSNFSFYYDHKWRNDHQESYTGLYRNKFSKQLDHTMACLREVANELNRHNIDGERSEDTAKQIQFILEEFMIFTQKRGQFQEELLGAFTDIGEKGFQDWEAGRKDRNAHVETLKERLINEINE